MVGRVIEIRDGVVQFEPLCRGIGYRHAAAREIIAHSRKTGRRGADPTIRPTCQSEPLCRARSWPCASRREFGRSDPGIAGSVHRAPSEGPTPLKQPGGGGGGGGEVNIRGSPPQRQWIVNPATAASTDPPDIMKRANSTHWLRLSLVALLAAGCAGARPPSSSDAPAQPWRTFVAATTNHVVDGDTVDVELDGRFARVRTVQIDAPESSSTRYGHPDRCGAHAKRYAETLTSPGAPVTLQMGGASRTDAYGRLLAIVHLGGAQAVTWQQRMVQSGWAEVLVYDGNATPLLMLLRGDAGSAKAHRLGVWAACNGHFHDALDREH